MTKSRLLILLLTFLIYSCNSRFDGETVVVGRAVSFDSEKDIINIRTDSLWKKIQLKGDSTKSYEGLIWSNTSDDFLAIEYSKNENGRTVEGDIVKFSVNGNLVQKVLDFKTRELAGGLHLSNNDNKLLFSLEHDHFDPENPLDQLNPPINILIVDYKRGEIIKTLDTVGLSMNVWVNNNPWLKDENSFIYDFRTDRKIKMANDYHEDGKLPEAGIYIYNIKEDKHSMLISGGYSGEVSPKADKITYIKDRKIWVYDVDTKSNEELYTLSKKESTPSVEWTPDGNYVYFVSYEDYMFDLFFDTHETLIRLTDKKLLKINHKNRYK